MSIRIINKSQQAYGAFNGGQIIENKPVGFPQDGGFVRPFSNLFYWAKAKAVVDSTIGQHPHQGFEILSFVLEGRIRHFDTKNNAWKPLQKGDVQIIRAGNGIEHAEHLEKDAEIFQIWFDPDLGSTLSKPATYDDYPQSAFPSVEDGSNHKTTLIGEGSPLTMDTPGVRVDRVILNGSWALDNSPQDVCAIYVLSGSGKLNDQSVEQDDFIIVEEVEKLAFEPHDSMEVFVMKLPAELSYRTYSERMAARWA